MSKEMSKEEYEAELKHLLKKLGEETGIDIPDDMLEETQRVENEARYFIDYLDARFKAQKFNEAYRMPMCMLIAQTLLAFIYKDLNDEQTKEMTKDLLESVIYERDELRRREQEKK